MIGFHPFEFSLMYKRLHRFHTEICHTYRNGKCEIQVLQTDVEARRNVLFGDLSSRISNKCKMIDWRSITNAANAKGLELRTTADIKKKWSDIKVSG